ncbi:PAS domain-containing protein [Mucilaginibacter aquaedulcis]|nr:PAS domain-containing protein [Mucilaginibacter aquaedulcis]MDN3551224.1 PAS domain-containing protein [Mucilaginibacter aquaedulcis]
MHRYEQINQFLNASAFFYTIAIGMDSVYTYVSPNYDRNFSFGKGTLRGQHFSVTLHPEDVRLCEAAGPQCFQDPGRLFPVTLRKHDGQGGFVTTQWQMQAMLDKQGLPQDIFCIGYNITEFVDIKTKLNLAETHLDEISFIQSHGVRKPLANIMGLTKLLRSAESEAEREELMNMLALSADEFDQIIQETSAKGTA